MYYGLLVLFGVALCLQNAVYNPIQGKNFVPRERISFEKSSRRKKDLGSQMRDLTNQGVVRSPKLDLSSLAFLSGCYETFTNTETFLSPDNCLVAGK